MPEEVLTALPAREAPATAHRLLMRTNTAHKAVAWTQRGKLQIAHIAAHMPMTATRMAEMIRMAETGLMTGTRHMTGTMMHTMIHIMMHTALVPVGIVRRNITTAVSASPVPPVSDGAEKNVRLSSASC